MTKLKIDHVAPDRLKPAPYNPRQIGDGELARLKRGIEEFGIVDPIIARRDGVVVGGHQRLRVAQDVGLETVPVVYLDGLDDNRSAALNVLLNNPGAQGEWDMPKLAELVSELDANGFDATLMGFDEAGLEDLLTWTADDKKNGDGPVPEPPADPVSRVGEVYELGPHHRVLCGDSTAPGPVSALLAGDVPLLLVTDPPYGVEYNPSWRDDAAAKGQIAYPASRTGEVENDDRTDWSAAWELFKGDICYVWHAGTRAHEVAAHLMAQRFVLRAQIVWRKSAFVISRGHYNGQHEPCWYGVRKGKTARWCGDHSQSTVWDVASVGLAHKRGEKEDAPTNHGTQKPVEIMARPMRNHGKRGDIVYDPFLGSGTTVIAAEQENRVCYGVEINPGYVDVIRQRYADYVGIREYSPTGELT